MHTNLITGGSDYGPSYANHQLMLDMNTVRSCVTFNTSDDTVVELNKDFKVILESSDAAVSIATQQAVVNILDDDSK